MTTYRYTFTTHKWDQVFREVCIESQSSFELNKTNAVLKRISDYIFNGTKNMFTDSDRTAATDLTQLCKDLIHESVESENAEALKRILEWFKNGICKMKKLSALEKQWKKPPGIIKSHFSVNIFLLNYS